jgi:hypothetical protein
VLPHFVACVLCFYLGLFVLGEARRLQLFWAAITVGFVVTLTVGLNQRFGSLAQTRDYVLKHEATQWKDVTPEEIQELLKDRVLVRTPNGGYTTHPEILKRVLGGRVFGTFIYPNALASAILLLLPVSALTVLQAGLRWPPLVAKLLLGALLYLALGCLYWSGSKAGWLVALAVSGLTLCHLPIPRQWKVGLLVSLLLAGGVGFAVKYSTYFQRGATSVGARFDGWQAAVSTSLANPILGSGPGTFGSVYNRIKPAGAEMARLTHNDFLEQASDSGIVGFLTYSTFFLASIGLLYRHSSKNVLSSEFGVWLGILGWTLQSLVEFSLYIPATSWLVFLWLGWLWGSRRNAVDKARDAG